MVFHHCKDVSNKGCGHYIHVYESTQQLSKYHSNPGVHFLLCQIDNRFGSTIKLSEVNVINSYIHEGSDVEIVAFPKLDVAVRNSAFTNCSSYDTIDIPNAVLMVTSKEKLEKNRVRLSNVSFVENVAEARGIVYFLDCNAFLHDW